MAHHLPGLLDQGDQDIERAAAQHHRLAAFRQQSFGRDQAERPEPDYFAFVRSLLQSIDLNIRLRSRVRRHAM